ncbi:DUF1642 domain-containing protein [Enterococcus faecalis]|uniref:DUF1642 domain-containing protein n=1 Tax=Enterococcus faecalis TaxID=1351 RepID=UPI0034CE3FA7
MNKQELIETLEEIKANIDHNAEISDYTDFSRGRKDAYNNAIGLVKQLDEPKKVIKVSREFDEWVQKAKTAYCSADLWKEWCIYQINQMGWGQWLQVPVACKDIEDSYGHHPEWTREIHDNKELHTRAILDGYEVEKEQLYYVKMPLIEWNDDSSELETKHVYLTVDITSEEVRLQASNVEHGDWKVKLTEERVKSIDERYWPFAVKVEYKK